MIAMNERYQPTQRELEEDVSIQTTPEILVRAVVSGGAPRREPEQKELTNSEDQVFHAQSNA